MKELHLIDVYAQCEPEHRKFLCALIQTEDQEMSMEELLRLTGETDESWQEAKHFFDSLDLDIRVDPEMNRVCMTQMVNPEERTAMLEWFAHLQLTLNHPRDALQAFFRLAERHQLQNDMIGFAADLGNVGTLFLANGDPEKAEEVLSTALQIHEEYDDPLGMALDLGNLGLVHAERREIDSAKIKLSQAITIFEELGENTLANQTRINLDSLDSLPKPTH